MLAHLSEFIFWSNNKCFVRIQIALESLLQVIMAREFQIVVFENK